MKPRILLPVLLLLIVVSRILFAQQTNDPEQADLVASAHFMTLTSEERNQLLSKAQSGDAEAQFWVGNIYSDGRLVQKDSGEAARWWLKASEQGYPPAQRAYGLASREENRAVSERWLLRAAEQNDTKAQLWLGAAYDQDWFGTVDVREATKWYRRAAEAGNPDAQVELGEKYEFGEGVEQDYKRAAEWYRKAAEHVPDLGGAGQGRNRLGLLYLQGLGVPQDYAQAYFWFCLDRPEINAPEAKSHLTDEQIRNLDRLVAEWKDQHQMSPKVAAAVRVLAGPPQDQASH